MQLIIHIMSNICSASFIFWPSSARNCGQVLKAPGFGAARGCWKREGVKNTSLNIYKSFCQRSSCQVKNNGLVDQTVICNHENNYFPEMNRTQLTLFSTYCFLLFSVFERFLLANFERFVFFVENQVINHPWLWRILVTPKMSM